MAEGQEFLGEIGRALNTAGEVLVMVKGGAHYSGQMLGNPTELGLAVEKIQIIPTFHREDVHVDSLGARAAADVMVMAGEVQIKATLIHYNKNLLELLVSESMGGAGFIPLPNSVGFAGRAGRFAPAGTLLGGRKVMYASGNHFFSVSLYMGDPQESGAPYRFRQCHMTDRPMVMPLGTTTSMVEVNFRAIPYLRPITGSLIVSTTSGSTLTVDTRTRRREFPSSGGVIWDRLYDDMSGDMGQ